MPPPTDGKSEEPGLIQPLVPARPARTFATLLESQVDVALCDIKAIRTLACMSESQVYEEIRAGDFPQPVIRQPRFTRWLVSDVRQYLVDRINTAKNSDTNVSGRAAKIASDAARAKRRQKGVE